MYVTPSLLYENSEGIKCANASLRNLCTFKNFRGYISGLSLIVEKLTCGRGTTATLERQHTKRDIIVVVRIITICRMDSTMQTIEKVHGSLVTYWQQNHLVARCEHAVAI